MTNQEILTKAIKKAQENGWYNDAIGITFIGNSVHLQMSEVSYEKKSYNDIIFNKDFAKSLWGDEYEYFEVGDGRSRPYPEVGYHVWQYRLQQMVISEDPIKYLEKFI